MAKMCKINKNLLLDLYFHESSEREARGIRKHVEQCSECREYLLTLEQTDHTLHRWKDEAPLPGTLDLIMEKIPQTQPRPVRTKPTLASAPFIKIVFSILAILAVISFVHEKITLFSFWETLQEWWFVKLIGSFGMTALLFFLIGAFITLISLPILLLESQSQKYKYYFS